MAAPAADRTIALEIAYNVRHIGGYAASGGHTSERLIRAGSLHRLANDTVDRLSELDVRAIVDFRSKRELEQNPTPDFIAAMAPITHAPVFSSDASPVGMDVAFPGFATVYGRFLDSGRDAYRTLAEVILATDGAVLFHCSAGKDRTGVAAALLLDLAEVDEATIVGDYAETERHLEPEITGWLEKMREREIPEEKAKRLLASEPEAMTETLRLIRERWGGAAGYFEAAGLSARRVDALRDRILA